MVCHVVLLRPRPNLSESDRQAMSDALAAAARGIPSIRRFQIGTRFTHGAQYERMMAQDFPYLAIVEFDDQAGLRAYLEHPLHQRLGTVFRELFESALVYDYEADDATAALPGTT